MKNTAVPMVGFCAYSGTGKTTLLCRLLPRLKSLYKLNVAVIKHAHHSFDTDQPGKDSYELRKAGAQQTLVSSSRRWVLISELADEQSEKSLPQLLAQLNRESLDLILIEGFKHEKFPKIELHRAASGHELMCLQDKNIIALACDTVEQQKVDIPVFSIDDADAIAAFLASFCNREAPAADAPLLKK